MVPRATCIAQPRVSAVHILLHIGKGRCASSFSHGAARQLIGQTLDPCNESREPSLFPGKPRLEGGWNIVHVLGKKIGRFGEEK